MRERTDRPVELRHVRPRLSAGVDVPERAVPVPERLHHAGMRKLRDADAHLQWRNVVGVVGVQWRGHVRGGCHASVRHERNRDVRQHVSVEQLRL
jgi:hypothetical protein